MKRPRWIPALAAAVVAACAPPPPVPPPISGALPTRDTTPAPPPPAREEPPPSGAAKPRRFPAAVWTEMPSGLRVGVVAATGLPVVHVRVVMGAGTAADGEHPGLARITALLVAGGTAAARLASIGADLSVDTGFDATTFAFSVTRDHLGEALDAIGALVSRPDVPAAALDRMVRQEAARLAAAARADGAWGASMTIHRDLFALPSEHHPYATWSATGEEARRITAADVRSFHRHFYVPRSASVVVAGDTTPDAARALAEKALAGFAGGEPPVVSFTDPMPPEGLKITLVDLPGSALAELFVGALGPARKDRSFASFAVAGGILGGATGRLQAHLRDRIGQVYDGGSADSAPKPPVTAAGARITELAQGPSVLVVHVEAPAAKTGPVLEGLLEELHALSEKIPDPEEVEAAQRALAESLTVRLGAPGALAGELSRLHSLGLPDDALEAYRKDLGEVTPALAGKAAGDHLRAGHEIVVASGDAAVIGPALARFGEVKVVDPTRGFARLRTIPMSADPGSTTPPPSPSAAAPPKTR
jgi:predicted Zn-dependent peptidase